MRVCRRILFSFVALSLAITATLTAHTMFLKLETFYLEPHSTNVVQLINGDFDKSENAITRDRMLDVSVVGPDGTTQPPGDAWADSAVYHWNADSVDTALLTFETAARAPTCSPCPPRREHSRLQRRSSTSTWCMTESLT